MNKNPKIYSILGLAIVLAGCNVTSEQANIINTLVNNPTSTNNSQPVFSQSVETATARQSASPVIIKYPTYTSIAGGKYKLTSELAVQTTRFGVITLTEGYESDGSSSPIPDTEETRISGFIHDALYSASGHLRFSEPGIKGWTRAQADDEYCELMTRLNVATNHQSANCFGVKNLPHIESAWNRLEPKRAKRWATYQ